MRFTGSHSREGAAAVEFAIILPVLIILVFGIIEFSVILFDKAMITNASREGARAGIVYRYDYNAGQEDPLDETEIENIVIAYCQSHLISLGGTSTLDRSDIDSVCGTNASGDPILTVTVRYQYQFLVLPNFITTLTGNINLTAQTVMRTEGICNL
ncbi:MAG: pilus assembly protein [Desulfobacteraceae bacterium]|nr:MAG: pilus assembly protein [Desulfobacteraceae bacterium]